MLPYGLYFKTYIKNTQLITMEIMSCKEELLIKYPIAAATKIFRIVEIVP